MLTCFREETFPLRGWELHLDNQGLPDPAGVLIHRHGLLQRPECAPWLAGFLPAAGVLCSTHEPVRVPPL